MPRPCDRMAGGRVIVTRGLTKRYGRVLAVDDIDLDVRAGDRYGFLGPNGSGKTTTVRMVLGLVFATRGEIELLGQPMPRRGREVLPMVGALVEGPAAYPHLSARANLTLLDASGPARTAVNRRNRRRRVDEVLEQVGLSTVGRRPVRAYSLGMRQRLGIAAALVGRPQLLILDEPTNGLDPQGIREIRDLLIGLNESGTTIFMSSHLLAEVEQLCTRVGVVDRGRLVAQAPLDDLRGPTGRAVVRVGDPVRAAEMLARRVISVEGDRLILEGVSVAEATALLVRADIAVHEATPERRSLEEAVLALTSHGSDRVDSPAVPRADAPGRVRNAPLPGQPPSPNGHGAPRVHAPDAASSTGVPPRVGAPPAAVHANPLTPTAVTDGSDGLAAAAHSTDGPVRDRRSSDVPLPSALELHADRPESTT